MKTYTIAGINAKIMECKNILDGYNNIKNKLSSISTENLKTAKTSIEAAYDNFEANYKSENGTVKKQVSTNLQQAKFKIDVIIARNQAIMNEVNTRIQYYEKFINNITNSTRNTEHLNDFEYETKFLVDGNNVTVSQKKIE